MRKMTAEGYQQKSIHPGELFVSKKSYKIRTILGSCVSVTIFDRKNNFGGMNHFMLPKTEASFGADYKYGDISTKKLIEKMLARGSAREDLVLKLFGGSRVVEALKETDIGKKNLQTAYDVISAYGLTVARKHIRTSRGMKLIFDNQTNKVLARELSQSNGSQQKLQKREAKISSILSSRDGLDLLN